jgi:Uma2 family endonuclease
MDSGAGYIPGMVESGLKTAEDLLRFKEPGKTAELVRGLLIVREPPGTEHGGIAATVLLRLGSYVERHRLGRVFAQDTGFQIAQDPDTVRAPDVAFVARERLAEIPSRGYAPIAPDLVVEILWPGDRPGEVLEKVGDWLNAGARLAWILDPARRAARVYRADGSASVLGPQDALDGEEVVPGFSLSLAELLK